MSLSVEAVESSNETKRSLGGRQERVTGVVESDRSQGRHYGQLEAGLEGAWSLELSPYQSHTNTTEAGEIREPHAQ